MPHQTIESLLNIYTDTLNGGDFPSKWGKPLSSQFQKQENISTILVITVQMNLQVASVKRLSGW